MNHGFACDKTCTQCKPAPTRTNTPVFIQRDPPVSPLLVQQLLGHASVATTQRYVATTDKRLRAAVEMAA